MDTILDALFFFGPSATVLTSYAMSHLDEFMAQKAVNELCRTNLNNDQFVELTQRPSWTGMQRIDRSVFESLMPRGFLLVAGAYYGSIFSFMAFDVIIDNDMQMRDKAFIGTIFGASLAYNIKKRFDRSVFSPFSLMNEHGSVMVNGVLMQAMLISPICIDAHDIQSSRVEVENAEFSNSNSYSKTAAEYISSEKTRLEGVIFESSMLFAANSLEEAVSTLGVEATLSKAGGVAIIAGASLIAIKESFKGKCHNPIECLSDGINRAAEETGRLPSILFQNDECQKNPNYKKCGLTIL